MTPLDRFLRWVNVNAYGCWVWGGALDHDGYGSISIGPGSRKIGWSRRRRWRAHRLAYEFFVGSTRGKVVMHSCDFPPCVNPDHLRLGTIAENNADRAAKGRSAAGDRHPRRLHPERWASLHTTHCPQGHDYAVTRDAFGHCRVCQAMRAKRKRERVVAS